jgi:gluconokinase
VDGDSLFIVMGVSGSGKSTFGRAAAQAIGGIFLDADDFHTAEKKAKMHAGNPLTDEDRWPWLDLLNRELHADIGKGKPLVLACSALKQRYRDRLVVGLPQARWVYLKGSFELLSARLGHRTGHFMPASLLQSQLDELEEPKDAMVIDVAQTNEQLVEEFKAKLRVIES